MATAIHDLDTLPPSHLDSEAAKFYEVVDGEIVENPAMGVRQSALACFLHELMGPFARSNGLGRTVTEILFWLDRTGTLKRRPDLAFVSADRWPLTRPIPETEAWDVVPDLAVEVISESNSAYAVARKIEDYFQFGVRKVWVIFPNTMKIYVYDSPTQLRILQPGDELDGDGIVPGFHMPVATLFQAVETEETKASDLAP